MNRLGYETDILRSRLLVQHPQVQQRLRAECLALPSYKVNNLPEKDELKNMTYLRNVIYEGRSVN